jgi:hypothetical protein
VGGEFGAGCAGVGAAALRGGGHERWRTIEWPKCGALSFNRAVLCCACPGGDNAA